MSIMNCKVPSVLLLNVLLLGVIANGQEIVAEKGSFGIDDTHKIVVWHVNDIDSLVSTNNTIAHLKFNHAFGVVDRSTPISYSNSIAISKGKVDYTLFITKLPIVHITTDSTTINDNSKVLGHFTYFNDDRYVQSVMGIRHRGNLSLTFPKKSFDIEFWTDSISKHSKDIKFKDLRLDDDWILDGLYNEPLRLRSFVAAKLWSKIHQPYYRAQEPQAKSGFDMKFVEVFKNQKYYGVYALSESVDRKQLKLKEYRDKIVLGELFKAESYDGAPSFKKAPPYNNLFPHWGGFQMRYPLIDYRAHWNDLAKLTQLVVNGTNKEFASKIDEQLHIANTIDYYLLVNLLRATDNLGKNYFIGRYDKEEPYFFIPWDLDGVFGTIQDGRRIATTDDILSNGLFDRLLKVNSNGYKSKVKSRWKILREAEFSDEALSKRIANLYKKFSTERIFERENLVWPSSITPENHYGYLKNWLNERLTYLDSHFENL